MIRLSNSVSYSTIFTHDHLCISISFWTDDKVSPLEEATTCPTAVLQFSVLSPESTRVYTNLK
jgi:hypothetical protein